MEAAPAAVEGTPAPYWKCVVAALPDAFVALEFIMVLVRKAPFAGADARWLTGLMRVEFIVIHSTVFIGLIALWKTKNAKEAKTKAIVFWSLFALYVLLAMKGGVGEFLLFLGLTFSTYLGIFLNWRSPSALVQLGARWIGALALFIVAMGVFDTPRDVDNWIGSWAVMRAGAFFFIGLAALELSGLYLRYIPPRANRIRAFIANARKTS